MQGTALQWGQKETLGFAGNLFFSCFSKAAAVPCVLVDYRACCAGSCCWREGSSFWSRAGGCGCMAWVVVIWILLPLLHRACLVLENRDICRVQRSQRGSRAGGPAGGMLGGSRTSVSTWFPGSGGKGSTLLLLPCTPGSRGCQPTPMAWEWEISLWSCC